MNRPAPYALVRPPGPSFSLAVSTHPDRHTLNYDQALDQHRQYRETLAQVGFKVTALPALPDFPDSTFIEDNAIILNAKAWLCPMGAPSRQTEGIWTGQDLASWIEVDEIPPHVQLDGGDVLVTDTKVFVGLSSRTSASAVNALQTLSHVPVEGVHVHSGLHLKSAATYLGDNKILLDPSRIGTASFRDFKKIEVPPEESYAANVLTLRDTVIMAKGFFGTQRRLEREGFQVATVPMSQFEKADGGITCLSIILP